MSGRPHYQFVARYMFVFLVVAAITASDQATGAQNISAQSKPAFAPDKMETILYGVAYYPEYMPYDRLDRDVELMQKAGITVVRVGESTWSTWEPHDGDFQFAWMQRVLDRLHAAGIKAILGTPTYSIPTWLYKEHPEIVVTHNGTAPPLTDPYPPTYPPAKTPGYYGPRQNYDFLNPYFRQHAERVIREIVSHFKDHPAVIGYQIDNETFPTGVPTPYMNAAFLDRLKQKYKAPDTINKIWGLVYWGQLVDSWDDLPPRNGILNPGYKLEWENFQHDVVTDYLAWQAKIVNQYKRPDQFITQDFSGGVHTNLDQWAIAGNLDIVAENPYFETQKRLDARTIWLSGDLGRSLRHTNYLVTETNAQTIGWDSRTQYPQYPGQLRLVVYTHLAAGANMVEYWHWHSLHYGQETYWKGVLSHDLEPNRTYAEVSRVASELKKLGAQLVDLKKDDKVAILFSADSANALSYMPVSDHVNYMTVLKQMYDALYDLNIEPDFVQAGDPNLSRYKVLLVPPLYSTSDRVLQQISDYVKNGGQVVMAFKSGFTNEYSTVRDVMAPGPLRAAAGFHYQEFTNLAEPEPLTPDPYGVGEQNKGSVWEEFLVPETAQVVASFDDPYWHFPAIMRNQYGGGTLTYEGTFLTDTLQREVIREVLRRAGLTGPDQNLPGVVKVRHGRNAQGKLLHYYLNFSGEEQTFSYPYGNGSDLLTNASVRQGQAFNLKPWDLAIVAEQ
ncbi:MAG TPA: beta-galactosidase [Candidatus Polarisedimenticolia bacterium]|nr:beta-galactosidase [Candidatus Polarisedimenticolia bacterium]